MLNRRNSTAGTLQLLTAEKVSRPVTQLSSSETKKRKGFCTELNDKLRQIYMSIYPYNFSHVTGLRLPHIPRLMGSWWDGRLAQHKLNGGLKQFDEILAAGKLAVENNTGMSYFWLGPNIPFVTTSKPAVLLVSPNYIEQVICFNKKKVERGELMASYLDIFGSHNLIPMPSNEKYKEVVAIWKKTVYSEGPLRALTQPLQDGMDDYIASLNQLSAENAGLDLQRFSEDMVMKLVAKALVGITENIETKELCDVMAEGARLTIDVGSQVALRTETIKTKMRQSSLLDSILNLKPEATPTALAREKMLTVAHTILKAHEPIIRSTDNLAMRLEAGWIKEESAANSNEPKESQANKSGFSNDTALDISTIFLGHIQVARVIQFTIMLLAQHPDKHQKLRAALNMVKVDRSSWTYDELTKVPYLKMVLQEVLRLYPPIPINAKQVIAGETICVGDVQFTNPSEYEKAMESRDKSRDVYLEGGDLVFFSAWVTHHLESEYTNADLFLPERFAAKNGAGELVCMAPRNSAWFPFSLGDRQCKGQNIARLEAMLAIAKIASKYNFAIENKYCHPFKTEASLQLQHAGKVKGFFTPAAEENPAALKTEPQSCCLVYSK